MSEFVWAVVTAEGILPDVRVLIDGDPDPLPTPPHDTLVDPRTLAVGDRVRCEWERTRNGRRLIIHHRSGGATLAADLAPAVSALDTRVADLAPAVSALGGQVGALETRAAQIVSGTSGGTGSFAITFGITFASIPHIVATPTDAPGVTGFRITDRATTGFRILLFSGTTEITTGTRRVDWIAIGPRT